MRLKLFGHLEITLMEIREHIYFFYIKIFVIILRLKIISFDFYYQKVEIKICKYNVRLNSSAFSRNERWQY